MVSRRFWHTSRYSCWWEYSRLFRNASWTCCICFVLLVSVFLILPLRLFNQPTHDVQLIAGLQQVEQSIDRHKQLQDRLRDALSSQGLVGTIKPPNVVHIPVLVIACNRPSVKSTLDALLSYRSTASGLSPSLFPITVSHGCRDQATTNVLNSYGNAISVIYFYDTPAPPKLNLTKFQIGYRAVAHHYKYALDHMFLKQNHSTLLIVEDDLHIAPDFFEYFTATLPLLQSDRQLFCVSAWNDNGRPNLIDETRNDLVYRSDFFSGLGWMMLRTFWLEIREAWPDTFWDEYLRQPYVRKERACLRPELGRTTTFGKVGISRGQYFDKYLKTMQLNTRKYNFLSANLTYLHEPAYTEAWIRKVYDESVAISIDDLLNDKLPPVELVRTLRVTYVTRLDFVKLARFLTLMEDIKSGVMRNAFLGVVPTYWKGRRLYIAPPSGWSGYQENWV